MNTMDRPEATPGKPPMSAEEQLAAMRQGRKTTGTISIGGYQIMVRVLSASEIDSIRIEGQRQAIVKQADSATGNLEIQRRTLMLATTINNVPQLGERVLSMMTLDELTYLYEEWIKFMDTMNPSLQHVTKEEFQRLVDALKKNSASPRDLSLLQLRAICTAYVDLIERQENQT